MRFNFTAIFIISLTLLIGFSLPVLADTISVGKTYPIIEPDALQEIKNKASTVNWSAIYNTNINESKAIQSPALPYAQISRIRRHTPIYQLSQSILDHNGKVIYPKGFEFNPLEYVALPSRILVIGQKTSDIKWVLEHDKGYDLVLTSGGNPLELSQQLQKPVFIVDQIFIERFNLKVVPTLISQEGSDLLLREYVINEKFNETVSSDYHDPA